MNQIELLREGNRSCFWVQLAEKKISNKDIKTKEEGSRN